MRIAPPTSIVGRNGLGGPVGIETSLEVSHSLLLCWRNGLGGPVGIETLQSRLGYRLEPLGEAAWAARSGLKPARLASYRNEFVAGETAWAARSGLKPFRFD